MTFCVKRKARDRADVRENDLLSLVRCFKPELRLLEFVPSLLACPRLGLLTKLPKILEQCWVPLSVDTFVKVNHPSLPSVDPPLLDVTAEEQRPDNFLVARVVAQKLLPGFRVD